jgi:CRISPR/Cas system CSM-associated protein Csm5 (group 7 of RAMP superfamily)
MLKNVLTFVLISALTLTIIFSPVRANSQTTENRISENKAVESGKTTEKRDLKQVFAKNLVSDSPTSLDSKSMEKARLDDSRKSNLSKGKKTAIYIGIGAAVAATVVIILATRNRGDGIICVTWCQGGCPCG